MNPVTPEFSERHLPPEPPPASRDALGRLLIQNSLGFAIITLDASGKVVSWNGGAELLFHYGKTEIEGQYFGRLFRKEDQAEGMPERELQHAVERSCSSDDNWLSRKDGSTFWASGMTTALRDEHGTVLGFAKMVRDASERKQLRAALRASEEKFQTAVAQIKDHAIFSTDSGGIITTWNEGCEHVLGYTEREAIGTPTKRFFPIDETPVEQMEDPLQLAAAEGVCSTNRLLTRKNGDQFWASVIITGVRDQAKCLTGYTLVFRDLTERQHADRAIRSSMDRLQLLSDTARHLLTTSDPLALLDRIFDRLVSSFELDFYFHFVADPAQRQLNLRSSRGIAKEFAQGIATLEFGSSPWEGRSTAAEWKPRIISEKQEIRDALTDFTRQLGITAYACYPLVANQVLLGTLSFGSRRERMFCQEQLELFAAIAHLFSEAIARSQVNAALTARESQLRAVLEGAPSGLLILDDQGRVLMVNAQAEHLFGYARDDLLGRSIERLLPSRGAKGASVSFLQGLLHSSSVEPAAHQRHEIIARQSGGAELPLEAWFSAARDPKPGFVIAAFINISERRKAEKILRENERKLRFLNELGEAIRALRDPVQIMAVVTRALGEHLQVSRCAYADVEADGDHFTIPQDYAVGVPSSAGKYLLSLFGSHAQQAMHEGRTLILRDVQQELPPGAPRGFAAINIQAIICCPLLKEGRLHAMMAVHHHMARDWTDDEIDLLKTVVERCWSTIERVKVEQALRQNEERLKLAMDAGRLGMWHLDTASGLVTIDARVSEFYSLPPEASRVPIHTLLERLHSADRARVSAALDQAAKGGAHFDAEFRLIRPDGTVRWLAGKGDLVSRLGETAPIIVGVNYDLTSRKKAEEELHAAQSALHRHAKDLESIVAERTAELRETVAELERFSYSLSHDMRAPLRAMQGFSQIVEQEYGPQLDDEGRTYLKRITAAARRLDQLISDVLSYTHVVREDVRLQSIQVAPLLRQLIAENPALQPPLAKVVVETPLLAVMGHEAYLTQCLSNLLTNGVKFVVPGRNPLVHIWTEEVDRHHVRLLVRDNGIGIPKEWQARIFGMFERMHPASHYDGTGIGLTIVRKAAERMGGLVGVDSEPGKGSTFWIQLDRPPDE